MKKHIVYGFKLPKTAYEGLDVTTTLSNGLQIIYTTDNERVYCKILKTVDQDKLFTAEEVLDIIKMSQDYEWHPHFISHLQDKLRRYYDEDRFVLKPGILLVESQKIAEYGEFAYSE